MPGHDEYGKQVLRHAAGSAFTDWGESLEINYGAGGPARIDGAVNREIAVEVESRTSKQVRGAVLDLICHRYPKKLLVLLPVHIHDPAVAAEQCRFILSKFIDPAKFRVVVLNGSGNHPDLDGDVPLVTQGLAELGFRAR